MAEKTIECSICCTEIQHLEDFNGEPMCQDCYHDPANEVFTDE